MRVSLLAVSAAVLLGGVIAATSQDKESFDPLADPRDEMLRRVERQAKEKKYNELKAAAAELAALSQKMSDEIAAGGKDVISVKIFDNLDRAEKLVKTMRSKAK